MSRLSQVLEKLKQSGELEALKKQNDQNRQELLEKVYDSPALLQL